jgi:hypothetical protein
MMHNIKVVFNTLPSQKNNMYNSQVTAPVPSSKKLVMVCEKFYSASLQLFILLT